MSPIDFLTDRSVTACSLFAPEVSVDLLIGIDAGTGGLDPAVHALLSVGICAGHSGDRWLAWEQKIWPAAGLRVDDGARQTNGYSQERWDKEGALEESAALVRLIEVLQLWKAVEEVDAIVCVAHGAGIDSGFLYAALQRCELVEAWEEVVRRRWRCSCKTFEALMDAGLLPEGSASLDSLNMLRGLGWRSEVHNASQDAACAYEGYRWQLMLLGAAKVDEVRTQSKLPGLPPENVWCQACGSAHSRPVSREHHAQLICFRPWESWVNEQLPITAIQGCACGAAIEEGSAFCCDACARAIMEGTSDGPRRTGPAEGWPYTAQEKANWERAASPHGDSRSTKHTP